MTNLWEFLLQTLYVSLLGGLLLVIKALLRDKLTPRWQYGVWGVLALRIWLPVRSVGKYILLPLLLWIETAKTLAEHGLSSAYTPYYTPVTVGGPAPVLLARPVSVTDWLFVIYAAGIAAFLTRYLVSYLRLRLLLRKGDAAPEAITAQMEAVGERYHLSTCRAVIIPGLPSPMVCGILRPVLALPAGTPVDAHVILHELLHLKYHDALQNVFWCLCRALHWCNPFVHYLMDRAGNDLESLCDQRVLERLKGEDRRTYGASLLAMANHRYPRAPGTTSVSNGGKNIARRIEAIVRFKKYPKGMALASVCVTVMLLCAGFCGTVAQSLEPVETNWFTTDSLSSRAIAQDLSMARLTKCTTVAGALDTYAKGLLYENGLCILAVTPEAQRPALEEQLRSQWQEDRKNCNWYHIDLGEETMIYPATESQGLPMEGAREPVRFILNTYTELFVYNLQEVSDDEYTAFIVLDVLRLESPMISAEDPWEEPPDGWLVYPVRVFREKGYVVEPAGEWAIYLKQLSDQSDVRYGGSALPGLISYQGEGKTGTVIADYRTTYIIQQPESNENTVDIWPGWYGETQVSRIPDPSAQFGYVNSVYFCRYTFGGTEEERAVLHQVGMTVTAVDGDGSQNASNESVFLLEAEQEMEQDGSLTGSDSAGNSWTNYPLEENWDGTVQLDGGRYSMQIKEFQKNSAHPAFTVKIYWNGYHKETLELKEVSHDGP